MTSVVIAGGGLMGLSAAFHLRRMDASVRVTVLERTYAGAAASGASAAGVRVMGRDPAERALAIASLRRWPALDRELEGTTGYRRGGGLRLALEEDALAQARAWMAEQCAGGVPLEIVDAKEARRLAPGIASSCIGAVHCPIDGQAEAVPTVRAFANAASRLGARVEAGVGVSAVHAQNGRVKGVTTTDGRSMAADVVIVAAGAWSVGLLAPLGVVLPLHTRALQMLLTEPAPGTLAPVLSAFDRALSFKQLADGAYLIGGGWPARIVDEAGNRWQVLEDSVAGSLAVAREVYPAIGDRAVARSWAGLEAFMPDDVPAIGPVPGVEGLLVATGFCGHGFALSPVVGDILARLALGADPLGDLWAGLRVDRPALQQV